MLKKFLTVIFALFSIAGILYLAIPNYDFPEPPPDVIVSKEPADLETPLRRGCFTDYSREEVLAWYGKQFDHTHIFGITLKLPTLLFNYPPENAATLIRDQTGSTFLQEYVHPFRESIYINGDKPVIYGDEPAFIVNGEARQLKIIIRSVRSCVWVREAFFAATMIMIAVVYRGYEKLIKKENG